MMSNRKSGPLARALLLPLIIVSALSAGAGAGKKASSAKDVDSGSFGIFVNGKRVATEVFRIEQLPDMSVAKSEIKVENGDGKASQTSELQITPSGDLKRYQWNELSPEKAVATVEPQDQFLIEHMTYASGKPIEQPFILPPSTMVLDDYFFSQRQILAWRYLASNCRPQGASKPCALGKAQFGVLVPRQRTSMLVTMEYAGREKVTVHGKEIELSRINLQAEGASEWALFLDDNYKLIRILIVADNTEVVRD